MATAFENFPRFVGVLFSLVLAGCSGQPPGSVGSTSFHVGKSLATIHQSGDRLALAVWVDEAEPDGCSHSDNPPGWSGAVKLAGDKRLLWSCQTSDGKHGTVTFTGTPAPKDSKPYQLVAGSLFLVTTQGGEVSVRQLDRDISGIVPDQKGLAEGEAKLKTLAGSDKDVRDFVAPTGK